ncbi:MAG TPA: type I DNA topoisomerase, partial [Geminicoccaceae bacterium]|nr:type I DNA topoisomerase [Geminicoccaceae bacterium]
PAPPFSTSTLQQEASRKLGFGAARTMQVAQRLFEGVDIGGETVGLITYMRTDSVQLSNEAIDGCRRVIGDRYGPNYLPPQPRQYRTKVKNAQEAHEAIRPTDMARDPRAVARHLDEDQRRLYELIWKRTLACQMASAVLDRVTVEVGSRDGKVGLRAVGTTIAFDGFIKVYREGRDDPVEDDEEAGRLLPPMERGEALKRGPVTPAQHFTEPPPRYTEASLVKRLEEAGVGRPSTYAAIISVLQDRNYVRLESKRFVPEDRGRLVSAFLVAFFDRYVQPGFTAQLEDQLDDVAAGSRDWRDVLRAFWEPFHDLVDEVQERRTAEILEVLNELLAAQLFPADNGADPRACPACGNGRLSLKVGRYGAFVGCSNYPECRYTRPFGMADGAEKADEGAARDRLLGVDPETGEEVWLKQGRFGPYVQGGARRASLPRGLNPDELDLDTALRLLALPRELGAHPETGQPIVAGIGRYGPYLKHESTYVNLGPEEDVLTIGINRAVTLFDEARSRKRAPKALRELGPHPRDGAPVTLLEGRFGPYVKHGRVNASLPKSVSADELTMDRAVELLAARAGKGKPAAKGRGGGAAAGRKAAPAAGGEAPAAKSKASAAKRKAGTAARSKAPPKAGAATKARATTARSGVKRTA